MPQSAPDGPFHQVVGFKPTAEAAASTSCMVGCSSAVAELGDLLARVTSNCRNLREEDVVASRSTVHRWWNSARRRRRSANPPWGF